MNATKKRGNANESVKWTLKFYYTFEKKMSSKQMIFYSWQSDLPKETNQVAIRLALRQASNDLESENSDLHIEVDEATRNTSGSPNIPLTIFDKITRSDIFICDLTTINSAAPLEFKKVPNPNVLIELGFAISNLGWERILMLFNTNFGTFPNDLPFDIDRHRASEFSIKDKIDNNGKKQLAQLLKSSIKSIIETKPLKPSEKRSETPEQRKRSIDISNLKWLLSAIHIPTYDIFIEEMPLMIIGDILHYKDFLVAIMESSTFYIYDPQLFKLLSDFKTTMETSLSFHQHYSPDGSQKNYRFYMPMDTFPNDKAEKDFKILTDTHFKLKKQFKELLLFIRQNYLEVDLEETSKNALEIYKR